MVMRSEETPCCPQPVEVVSSCAAPLFVEICNPEPGAQVELSDLALGCALDGAGNAIGVVVLSKVFDEDLGVETQVRVMYPYGGGAPVSPYTGAFGSCADAEVTSVVGCADGAVPVVIHYIHATPGAAPAVLVTDAGGVVVAYTTLSAGQCAIPRPETPHFIYLERNGGVVAMADILAVSGARQVLSVTVKQISGRGSINGDAGSGVPMDAGETWSWSVQTDDHMEFLSLSALQMDAGGGEQRITATYIR